MQAEILRMLILEADAELKTDRQHSCCREYSPAAELVGGGQFLSFA